MCDKNDEEMIESMLLEYKSILIIVEATCIPLYELEVVSENFHEALKFFKSLPKEKQGFRLKQEFSQFSP